MIDVEGVELDFLKGRLHSLDMTTSPALMIEINGTSHHPSGFNPNFSEMLDIPFCQAMKCCSVELNMRQVSLDDIRQVVIGERAAPGHNFLFLSQDEEWTGDVLSGSVGLSGVLPGVSQ